VKPIVMILLFLLAPASGVAGSSSDVSTAGMVRLTSPKPLREKLDAWPLIDHPSSAAQVKINAEIRQLNKAVADIAEGCAHPAADDPGSGRPGFVERQIEVTLRGPRYLSMVAGDGEDCGGAHPANHTEVIIFDLTTGVLVNPMTLLAKSAGVSMRDGFNLDGTKVDALIIPGLAKMYIDAAPPDNPGDDCKDVFSDRDQAFYIWPDAKKGTLDVEAFGVPQVVSHCAYDMNLSLDQARKLGFSETLLRSIETAHANVSHSSH
jgi:hypothetical protein